MDINVSRLPLEQVLVEGEREQERLHQESEVKKLGILRAGSPGCIVGGMEVYGGCHRYSIARALGLSIGADGSSDRYFEAGRVTEDVIASLLQLGYKAPFKREEEAGVSWTLNSGRLVTGRPDFLLLEPGSEGRPATGIELKTIASPAGAARVFLEHKPDPKHLTQALVYMWQHQVPWILTYVSVAKHNLHYNDQKKYGARDIPPYRMHFYLGLKDGQLFFKNPVTGEDVPTVFTIDGLKSYFELVDECISRKELAFMPVNNFHDGSVGPWRHEKYCKYCQLAEQVSGNWDHWCDELSALREDGTT